MTNGLTGVGSTTMNEADHQDLIGRRIGALLNERTRVLPHDIQERLRFSREQALVRAAASAIQPTSDSVALGSSGAMVLGGRPAWLTWLGSAVPLALLLAGLAVIDDWHDRAQIHAAAVVDTDLLSDELPPLAYSDPGFAEFLRVAHD